MAQEMSPEDVEVLHLIEKRCLLPPPLIAYGCFFIYMRSRGCNVVAT